MCVRVYETDFICTNTLTDWNVIAGGKKGRKLDQDALNTWQQHYWYAPDLSIAKTAAEK